MSFSVCQALIAFSLTAPLMAGLLAMVGGKSLSVQKIVQGMFALAGFLGFVGAGLIWLAMSEGAPAVSILFPGGLFPPLFLDVWSAAFFALVNGGVLLASLFAIGYLPRYQKIYHLSVLNAVSSLFIVGMLFTVLASSIFSFLFFWEAMSLAAYFLVIADHEEASLKAGFLYLIMTHLGVASLLFGFLLLSGGAADMSFAALAHRAIGLPSQTLALAFAFLFIGFGSKAGLVPLHQWLPYAHPQAPSHSSALMSGVMLKVAIYGFLRLTLFVFPSIPKSWALAVLAIGLLSAFFGVMYALVETDVKRLLAWSSVENVGLIFSMLGAAFLFKAQGLPASIFFIAAGVHIVNHAIFKSGLFLSAGAILSETHTRNLDALGGLAKPWPLLSMAFLALGLAAAGLPPFGTFYGEWLYLQSLGAALAQTSSAMSFVIGLTISLVALVGGCAVFTFMKAFAAIFLSKPRSQHAEDVRPLPVSLLAPIVLAASASLLAGCFVGGLASRLGVMVAMMPAAPAAAWTGPLMAPTASIAPRFVIALFVFLSLFVVAARYLFARRSIRLTDTWDCGQPLTSRMEYTATGFAAPMRFFFRAWLLSRKQLSTERLTPGNPWMLRRRLEWSTQSLWEAWFYQPLAAMILSVAERVKRLQNGIIQFYLFLMFATLILVLVIAL